MDEMRYLREIPMLDYTAPCPDRRVMGTVYSSTAINNGGEKNELE